MGLQLETEKDVERLRQAALLLEAENRRLVARVVELTRKLMSARGQDAEELQLRLREVERQLAQRNAELFGRSSEKRPRPQLDEEDKAQQAAPGHGPRAQPMLPLLEVVHTLEEPNKQCPQCGGVLAEMEGCWEEAEEVDVVQRRFVLKRHQRQKYRCGCGGCVETALGPPKLQPGGRYSVDFAVEVAVAKYLDHLPLERQVRVMQREGLTVDSQTLGNPMDALARLLAPAHEALHAALLTREILGGDETRWPLLGSKSQTRWHAWALCAPDAVVYRIQEGRDAKAARHLLQDFDGILMVDGLSTYESVAAGSGGKLTLVHCWMHARRKYVECAEAFPQAEEALEMIAGLYAVEREYKQGPENLVCGVDPKRYLREASLAALREEAIPLPNQLAPSATD